MHILLDIDIESSIYGRLFLSHIAEDITDSPTFSDGVPKEGLRIQDVLVRIAILMLIRDKVKSSQEGGPALFADDLVSRFPGLKIGKLWKEEHDRILLRAVLKHGYGRWQAIVDDKELRIQEVICQVLNLPFINLPAPGDLQGQNSASGAPQMQSSSAAPQTQVSAPGVSQAQDPSPGFLQAQNGMTTPEIGTSGNQVKGTNSENDQGADVAQGITNSAAQTPPVQDHSVLYSFREMQRRQVEFIKKRVLLLEKVLNAEYQKEYFGDKIPNEMPNEETGHKVAHVTNPSFVESDDQMIDHLPRAEMIFPEEVSNVACDNKSDRLGMVRFYNEMCKVLTENAQDSVEAHLADKQASLNVRRNLAPLEAFNQEINHILSPASIEDEKAKVEKPSSSSIHQTDDFVPQVEADTGMKLSGMDVDLPTQSNLTESPCDVRNTESSMAEIENRMDLSSGTGDVEMEAKDDDDSILNTDVGIDGSTEKVILLDD
ncbi:CHD3-type chromatin-remodeling factor PICKLE [Abeliophyllum distichum]|uniref:CHD3-type chromatin-remodeling factor PICKLE n=1 Tax=Abeliophyllum distichum TaxID=126358 RepID=A0ABD1VAQ6_9LAMI